MKHKQNLLFLLVAIAPVVFIVGLSHGRSLSTTVKKSISVAASPIYRVTQKVSLVGGRVSFVLPSGFTAMTPQEIALKFPRGNSPQYAYANERRSVTVAITFFQARVTPEQLPELRDALPSLLAQAMPITKWITQAPTTINNRNWVRMEFISQAVDTKIYNDLYFTSFDGKLLGFNFNATKQQYAALKAELSRSRDSIAVK